jgi:hypothetical protein
VATLVRALGDGEVEPVSVVGFPHGAHLTEIKLLEARRAADEGACAVDVVAPLGRLRSGEVEGVLSELRALVSALAPVPVRIILETGLLPPRSVVLGAGLALAAGCDAVKTSTGFNGPGARPEDVALLRAGVGAELGVKASGGFAPPRRPGRWWPPGRPARRVVVAGTARWWGLNVRTLRRGAVRHRIHPGRTGRTPACASFSAGRGPPARYKAGPGRSMGLTAAQKNSAGRCRPGERGVGEGTPAHRPQPHRRDEGGR